MPLPASFAGSSLDGASSAICNRYQLIETIGVGSYGSVHKATDLKTNVIRALKTIKLPVGEGEKVYEEAVAESRLLSQLSHPHIVTLLDAFPYKDSFHIVMELCSEGTLDESIEKHRDNGKPFELDHICCWIAQMADALAYIHSRRILHRDLKTKNIFLSRRKENSSDDGKWEDLKIGDFGISRTLVCSTDEASTCIGTPYYFSPEVFKQAGYNHKADMWAVGCILYELCSLQHPFVPADNLPQLMHRVVTKEPSYSPWTHPTLLPLCTLLLLKNPKTRLDAIHTLKHTAIATHISAVVQ